MRDPAGNQQRYAEYFQMQEYCAQSRAAPDPDLTLEQKVQWASNAMRDTQTCAVRQFGAGLPLADVAAAVAARLAELTAQTRFVQEVGGPIDDAYRTLAPIEGNARMSVGFATLALTLLPDPADVLALARLLSPAPHARSYLFDLLLEAFAPDLGLQKKYKADKYQAVWQDPVLRAIAQPPQARAAALAAHMKNWCRVMRPWGWKSNLDTAPGKDPLFCDFAFEVALAVCAYDIDDSLLRDHPYYPRELVDHYRDKVRHGRDAGRAAQAGAGVPVLAPPLPAKADLARSKRKGVARWVELLCDGDLDATAAVLEAAGNPRTLKNVAAVLDALAENGQAIRADLRDDRSVELSCGALAEARSLGQFDGPSGPDAGLPRCVAILTAFDAWLPERGYRLIDFQLGDDSWALAVARDAYCQELIELGTSLGVPEKK